MIKKVIKTNKAFSLLEVLLAIVLLALIATPVLQMIYCGLDVNIRSRKLLGAADLTTEIIEFSSSKPFDNYTYKVGTTEKTIKGLSKYYYGSSDTSTSLNELELKSSSKVYPLGPDCTYSSLKKINLADANDYPIKEFLVDSTPSNALKELKLTNIDKSGFKYDAYIYIQSKKHGTEKYYNYEVKVVVKEHDKTAVLCEATTYIMNSY